MYFEMLLARRQHCVHFEGMKVQQRWKNVCHGNIYSNLKHCSAKDTNLKKRIWCCYYSHFHAYSPLVSCPRPNFNTKDIIWFKCFKAECHISQFIKNVLAGKYSLWYFIVYSYRNLAVVKLYMISKCLFFR